MSELFVCTDTYAIMIMQAVQQWTTKITARTRSWTNCKCAFPSNYVTKQKILNRIIRINIGNKKPTNSRFPAQAAMQAAKGRCNLPVRPAWMYVRFFTPVWSDVNGSCRSVPDFVVFRRENSFHKQGQ